MAGAIISYRNDVDPAVLSGGATAEFGLANLKVRALSTVWRNNVAGATPLVVDFGAPKVIRLFAMANTNARFDAVNATKIEYSANGSAWTDTGVQWAREGQQPAKAKDLAGMLLAVLPGINARYWRITPAWARVDGATYYEAGRLWLGDAIVIPEGVEAGWSRGFTDAGRLDFAAGLEAYEDPRPRARAISFSFSLLPPETAYGFTEDAASSGATPSFDGLQMEAGLTGEVIAVPITRTPLWARRTGVYGHIADSWQIRHQDGPLYATDLRVIEER